MKAIIINKFGNHENLIQTEIDHPKPNDQQLLVEVYACGLNPADYKIRNGELEAVFPSQFPKILGSDISGVVKAVGSNVRGFLVGDEVFFSSPLSGNGGYAEMTVVDADIVAKKPKALSHQSAASLPVVGLTAIQTLRDFAQLKAGENVLIHAGAGGVGSFAIQYAKSIGAKVFATGSAKRYKYLKSLGADVVIDYKDQDFVTVAQEHGGMDVILESIGGDNYLRSIEAAKENARIPCIVHLPSDEICAKAKDKNIKTDFYLLNGNREDLHLIADLADSQTVKAQVSEVFEMDEIQKAHILLESGRVHGKLVLNVRADS